MGSRLSKRSPTVYRVRTGGRFASQISRTSVESALEVTQVWLPEYPIVSKPHPGDLNGGDVALQRVLEAVLERDEVGYLTTLYARGGANGQDAAGFHSDTMFERCATQRTWEYFSN